MMEFYERVSGARMHAAYVRPGGVAQVMNGLTKLYRLEMYTEKIYACFPTPQENIQAPFSFIMSLQNMW